MGLSAVRVDQFTEAFEVIGGKKPEVSKDQLAVIMRSLGQNPMNDEVTTLFNKHTGGSELSLESVLAVAGEFEDQMGAADQKAGLKEAFAVFDKDKSGKISGAELRHVIANIGEKVDEDELEDMMRDADKDGNGTIDYNEFVSVLLNPVAVPPKVTIPEELKPYMAQLEQKEAKKHGGDAPVEAS